MRPPTVRVWDAEGNEHDVVLRTKSGRVLTEQEIDRLADEAERGYDAPPTPATDGPLRERIQAVLARQVKPPHILTDEAGRVWLAGRDAGLAAIGAVLAATEDGGPGDE